nr:MAG TPA: hypothetical protein [Bacteriophage sp.]
MRTKSRPITAHLHATPLENGGHCQPSERTTEDLQPCKSTHTSAAYLPRWLVTYGGVCDKTKKPGPYWAFFRVAFIRQRPIRSGR